MELSIPHRNRLPPWVPWSPLNTHIHLLPGIAELPAWARPSLGPGMSPASWG